MLLLFIIVPPLFTCPLANPQPFDLSHFTFLQTFTILYLLYLGGYQGEAAPVPPTGSQFP